LADPLPDSLPPAGATFEKPYTEVEYRGKVYPVKGMVGGHNGRSVVEACEAHPPRYDSIRGRWVVPLDNNLISINLAEQPEVGRVFGEGSPLARLRMANHPGRRFRSGGLLVTNTTDPNERPAFPVDCEFEVYLRIRVPGKWPLVNPRPLRLLATELSQWPPPVGTVYRNLDGADFYPDWVGPLRRFMKKPIVRILPGDETILTEVFVKDA
jgi:hypothetical protein